MDTVPHETFGELLRRYRRTAGLTQEELAEGAGVSADTISNIERGAPHIPRKATLRLLAQALKLSPQDSDDLLAAAREAQVSSRSARLLRMASENSRATSSSVPLPPTSLVGREGDLATAQHTFRDTQVRLLTITGAGGVGKTQFAFALARELEAGFSDGIHIVYLAPLRDATLISAAIAGALGLRETGPTSFADLLLQHLREKSALLLLDNFEHLLSGATLVADLLAACAHLKILVTSRSPLHLRGEHEYLLAPLALPSAAEAASIASLARVPAVELFVQRAQSVRPSFVLDASNAAAVAAICQRLDGLPLAIELAAARSKMLSPQALLERLDEARLPLLTGGARDLPARQRTLRDTLAWSYELLTPPTRVIFRRLAVFAGGCTLDAVESVCESITEPADIFETLATLVDHSLLHYQPEEDVDDPRFVLLETVREFGWELLNATGEREAIQRAHAEWCLELAEHAETKLRGNQQAIWLNRLDGERDNLRAALAWTLDGGNLAVGLRLAPALWRYWFIRGHYAEGRQWLESLLAAFEGQNQDAQPFVGESAALTAKVLYAIGALARTQGDLTAAREALERSLALYEQLGDKQQISYAVNGLGAVEEQAGNSSVALTLFERSLAMKRELGDQLGIANTLTSLGLLYLLQKNFDMAAATSKECIAVANALGSEDTAAWGMSTLAQVCMHRDDLEQAADLATGSLALRRKLGDRRGIMNCLGILGEIEHRRGDVAGALELYRQNLNIAREIGVIQGIEEVLVAIAVVYRDWKLSAEAVRLLAAAKVLQVGPHPGPEELAQGILDDLRAMLKPGDFAAAWTEGLAMPLDQALAIAYQPVKPPAAVLLPTRRASSE